QSLGLSEGNLESATYGDRVRRFKDIGALLSVYRSYHISDIGLDVFFSKENMRESVSMQRDHYVRLMKLLTCFDRVIDGAV
ncbi:MAG: hypothetical protein IJX13_02060, partial [Clostridia bacterium]|nr:hypothetical protein [Clostridia bacterium]